MIIKETVIINDKEFTKTYSDSGFQIQEKFTDEEGNITLGNIYDEAIDILEKTYIETNIKIGE